MTISHAVRCAGGSWGQTRTKSGDESQIKSGELRDTHLINRSLELDKRIVAAECDPRTFERLAHEERARRGRSASEGYQVETGQSLTSLGNAHSRQIPWRCVEREADFSELPAHEVRRRGPRESHCEIGIAPCDIERTDTRD